MATDKRLNKLGIEYGDFAAMLYTWMIPHAEDSGCLNGDLDEFIATVIPMRRDKSAEDVAAALKGMVALDLIEWDGAEIRFPPDSFYRYQSYVKDVNRRAPEPISEEQRKTPQNIEEHCATAQNAVSSSFSSSLSVSSSSSVSVPPPIGGSAQKRAAPPKKGPLTSEQRDLLLKDFAELSDVEQRVEEALAHTASKKATSEYLYLRSWLRKDLNEIGARAAPRPMPPRSPTHNWGPADADDATAQWARIQREQAERERVRSEVLQAKTLARQETA
jgi:hypothetical protein